MAFFQFLETVRNLKFIVEIVAMRIKIKLFYKVNALPSAHAATLKTYGL